MCVSVCPVASPEIHEADRLLPIEIEYFGEHVNSMHENRDKKFEREYEVRECVSVSEVRECVSVCSSYMYSEVDHNEYIHVHVSILH